jgi:hypothetical protein
MYGRHCHMISRQADLARLPVYCGPTSRSCVRSRARGPCPLEASGGRGEAVGMATAWISVIGSAVAAVAALGGVMLAQRATRARDLDGRIWECRSRAYEDLMHWILATSRAVDVSVPGGEADGRAPGLSGDQARALLPAPDLEARVTAYASTDILRGFRHCQRLLASPPRQGGAAADGLGCTHPGRRHQGRAPHGTRASRTPHFPPAGQMGKPARHPSTRCRASAQTACRSPLGAGGRRRVHLVKRGAQRLMRSRACQRPA